MGLNVSKGNMYPWVTHTWNTIKGKCPHDCSYCYMKRWGELNPVHFVEEELQTDLGKNNFIFVGSSCDMFAQAIPSEWIFRTLEYCKKFNNTYLFQSKDPSGFVSYPVWDLDKIILCTTLETNRVYPNIMRNTPDPVKRAIDFGNIPIEEKYITVEPIIDFDLDSLVSMIYFCKPKQVNIGADSGENKLPEPSAEKVQQLISEIESFTMVKLKRNLNRILNLNV